MMVKKTRLYPIVGKASKAEKARKQAIRADNTKARAEWMAAQRAKKK